MSDCGNCKKMESCKYVGAMWWPASAFVFCRPQVLFFLLSCDIIRQGEWPQPIDGSSYIDPAIRSNFIKIPSHNCEVIAAEIDARIKMCGIEGKLMEYEVKLGYQLSDTSKKALNYCSGWRRRKESYRSFKARTKK